MAFGEVFVGALLQVLFEKLAVGGIGQIMKYVKGKKIDPKTIQNFHKSLRRIAALLNDAQTRRIESESFKLWVEELQDLAYDLEDVLDELATDAQLQLQQQQDDDEDGSVARNITCLQSAKNKVKDILACSSRAVQRVHYSGGELPSKIQELNSRLQDIHMQGRLNLGLSDDISKLHEMQFTTESAKQRSWRETTSLVSEPTVYGRENMKHDVIQKLLNEERGNNNHVVFSFVGKGGIGKTTLAQYVYNDQQLQGHFNFKAWVCVSDVFDVTRVTTEIINSSSKNSSGNFNNLDEAQLKLIEMIKDKRFLIILDDMWSDNYDDWIQLKTPLQYGARGSRVIVTTRIEEVAMIVIENPTYIIKLEGLSDKDCWSLFKQHLSEDTYNSLDDMRDDIINKCKGLPLAAKALGGLFKKTTDKSKRRMILNSHIWTEESNVLPILRLSYYHLPTHLKHIFAYCCVLPKDYEFEEMEVILLWMAQGFLVAKGKERIEDVGHMCFLDLVSRSLFERIPSSIKKRYVMHDLVHDLAQWAAGDLCCCVDMKDVRRELARTRHLYISNGIVHAFLTISQPVATKLRTVICPAEEYLYGFNVKVSDFFMRYRCVRTLILASNGVDCLPECVGDLIHLRFLDLKLPEIRVFPNSIGKLCNLEVLFLEGCCNLREVTNIKNLMKLRHLSFHQSLWVSMPWGIRKLSNLQSLGTFYLGVDRDNNESMIKVLGSLRHLHGKLCMEGLENVRKVEDAREAKLHEKLGLKQINLSWGKEQDEVTVNKERDVLEQLKPHSGIEVCELNGYMGLRFPSWLGDCSFKNMVSIMLVACRNCECLPPLGQLRSLKKLHISNMDEIKEVGLSVLGGPCLEELYIGSCESLISITESPVELTDLSISYCTQLQKVEFKKCIRNLATSDNPHKVHIYLGNCDVLVTIGRIPLTVHSMNIHSCKNLKYILFDDKAMESKDEEKESTETIQESSYGGDNSLLVSEKKVQNDPPIILPHLLSVSIIDCENFTSLTTNLFLPSIQSIVFKFNEKQQAIPEKIHTFSSLEKLSVYCCRNINCFPKGGLPKNLRNFEVYLMNIVEPPIGEWGLHLLPYLQRLTIKEIGSTTDIVECIPGPDLQLPSSLSGLEIWGFKNLKSFNCSSLPNLMKFEIRNCQKLENLGDYNCLPLNLTCFRIIGSPKIQQQCEPDPNGLIALDDFTENRYILTNSPRIRFEQEPEFFFNMKYFEDEVRNGNWNEVERYLSGFTKVDDNRYSIKIFFEIRKQKYFEALDKHDRFKAVDILVEDMKVFSSKDEELFKEITQLLTLDNFREHQQLSNYRDTKSARAIMLVELKKLIEANPVFNGKLQCPN